MQIALKKVISYEPKKLTSEFNHTLKTTHINNRRYLGNKYRLLPFIISVVEKNCNEVNSVADIFAGTGAVASAFTDKQIITNDNLYSNYICHVAWFSPQEYSRKKIEELVTYYNDTVVMNDNYMSNNFKGTFFSRADCRKIGFIRDDIEARFTLREINERERALLITSLLYAADKIANTCGHYDAFRQGVEFEKHLELSVPLPADNLNAKNICYNEDTNELVKHIFADLVYIDSPYNSRQYCDAYHLLENIARWEKPKVSGVARKMVDKFEFWKGTTIGKTSNGQYIYFTVLTDTQIWWDIDPYYSAAYLRDKFHAFICKAIHSHINLMFDNTLETYSLPIKIIEVEDLTK